MELAQWFQLSGAVVGLLALVVNAYKALNRKSAAYEQASNSLALIKALDDLALADEDLRRSEERRFLRETLLDRSYFYSQLYSRTTEPVLGTHWQTAVFFILGVTTFISQVITPLTGSMDDALSRGALVALPAMFFAAGYLVAFRVNRNKAVLKNLREPARLFYPQDVTLEDTRLGRIHELFLRAGAQDRSAVATSAATEDAEMSAK
ncbi:hypothetical protein [Arthrobacter sp. AFG20]|uniref:hypothetical protein n=1 Tax=Arthrobacter sp. AFG20 TaxID=1688671 RepID=UPI000C9EAB60|nr:hypothetical protein [Arthrobacter sp. AFG20]PNH79221.1 hypothetical protein CXZ05_20725 [Arthrobacter sp. AFG20]